MPAQDQWTAVDRYVSELLVPPDPVLDAALAASAAAGLPPYRRAARQRHRDVPEIAPMKPSRRRS